MKTTWFSSVGDSQVEAAAASFEELPETILERYLKTITQQKVRVFSIGASGWSQDQQLLALREYFQQFRANLAVLWHTPINDFWENAFPDRLPAPAEKGAGRLKPTFFLDDQQGRQRIELFHPPIIRARGLARNKHGKNIAAAWCGIGYC
jgi:hypothetical protein